MIQTSMYLFFTIRINIFNIVLPSLRERTADLEQLAGFFLRKFSAKVGKKITGISDEYLNILKKHSWKGNIRELRNIIERSVILEDTQELTGVLQVVLSVVRFPAVHS